MLTATLVKADTSRLVAVSDEEFVFLVASELAVVDSEVLSAACEVLALTSLLASLVAVSLAVWLVFSLDAALSVATPLKISAAVTASLSEVANKEAFEGVETS